ncbi:MAG: alanine racemase, partial [Proteobacteria bacterium]|nr:alanine racemase [Pseudomonadota bacterium]
NSQAIQYNYNYLKSLCPTAEVGAVMKADAYGMKADHVAPLLKEGGCQTFFVAYLEEGIKLRQSLGKNVTIFVLNGLFKEDIPFFYHYNLWPILTDLEKISYWDKYCKSIEKQLPCGLHVDTGISRTGLPENELKRLTDYYTQGQNLDIRLIMSHLACADDPHHSFNLQQLQRFLFVRDIFEKIPASFANSGGIFLKEAFHFDLVRPGLALYGIHPQKVKDNPLKLVLSLWAKIYQVQEVKPGQTVGYSKTYRISKKGRMATLALGYADGIPWSMASCGYVMLAGYQAPIIGRISMDLITVDVSHIPSHLCYPGAWVEIFGPSQPIEEWAKKAGTIPYELMLKLGPRLHRFYYN